MQQAAQYQAVIELITEIFKNRTPADSLINSYLRDRKYIGSKDRRFITDMVWKILRNRRKLEFDANSQEPRKILMTYLQDVDFDLIFGNGEYAPVALTKDEKNWLKNRNEEVYPADVEAECPKWLFDKIQDMNLLKALNEPASADLRINAKRRVDVVDKLQAEGLYFTPTPYSPIGIRSSERVNLNNCIAYKEGLIDVQDESSQLAAILCDVSPSNKTIDYCCGAGGKSLTIAYLMGDKGKIYAHDINWGRLEAIKDRSERLGIKNIEIVKELKDNEYDRFIIDAPCSGTGTWRRSPDAKFRLTPEKLAELNKTQLEILETAYSHTKIGGRIVYITCSILHDENENIIEKFKAKHPDICAMNLKELWSVKLDAPYPCINEQYLRFSPVTTGTDGFFFTVLLKK